MLTAHDYYAHAVRRACQLRIDAAMACRVHRPDIAGQLRTMARHYLNVARFAALKS